MNARWTFLVVCAALTCGCASTEFKMYEGRGNSFEGRGGTKTVVDGMDVWDNGEPPRRFKILGFIQDDRPGGIIAMSQLRSDIVKKARQVGGDAVIQAGSQSQIAGYYSAGSATATTFGNTTSAVGTGFAMPVRRNSASFVVVKFEDTITPVEIDQVAPEMRKFSGYWSVVFAGATSGDCANLLIDPNGRISASCRLLMSPGVYSEFSVAGGVNAAGAAALTATTGATMSGVFSNPSSGSGNWTNGTASGTWIASRI
jgi:hypothetical protein